MPAKVKSQKLLVSTLLIAFICSPFVSMAFAAPNDRAATTDSGISEDGQNLIAPAPENEQAPTSEDTPILIQQRDSNTNATDSSATSTEGGVEDEQNLIATNTGSDSSLIVAGTVALAAAIALGVSVAVVRSRKK